MINVKTADITQVSSALKELVAADPSKAVQGEYTFKYTESAAAEQKVTVAGKEYTMAANKTAGDLKTAIETDLGPKGYTVTEANGTITIKGDDKGTKGLSEVTGDGVSDWAEVNAPKKAGIKGPEDTASYQKLIETLDAQITSVSRTRGEFGAVQNRFEHTIANLNVAVENLSASESRTQHTDMAEDSVHISTQIKPYQLVGAQLRRDLPSLYPPESTPIV